MKEHFNIIIIINIKNTYRKLVVVLSYVKRNDYVEWYPNVSINLYRRCFKCFNILCRSHCKMCYSNAGLYKKCIN